VVVAVFQKPVTLLGLGDKLPEAALVLAPPTDGLVVVQTKHYPIAGSTAVGSGSVENTFVVYDQSSIGVGAIATVEAVKNGFSPIERNFKHRAAVASAAAASGGAIKRVINSHYVCLRLCAIRSSGKIMKHSLGPIAPQLKEHTLVCRSSQESRSIKIARFVTEKAADRPRAIASAAKAMERGKGSRRRQLENGAGIIRAAEKSGAIEIARFVPFEPGSRVFPVAAYKGVKYLEASIRSELINCSVALPSKATGNPIEIPL